MNRHHPRHVDKIIEEQFRLWSEISRVSPVQKIWPIVTISRQYGAGGTSLGRCLSQLMKFSLWDQELVHAIAENTGASENLVRSLDEQKQGTLADVISNFMVGAKGTEVEYIRQIHRIVHTLHEHGSSIIIGRGAQCVVGNERAFKLRCIAPLKTRIARVMAEEHLEHEAAEEKILSIDRERERFHKHYFNHDVNDPSHYHLVINTAPLPVSKLAEVVFYAYQLQFGNPVAEQQ